MIRTGFLLAFAATLVSVEGFVPATSRVGKPTFTTTSLKAFDIAGTTSAIDAFYHTQPYAAAFMTCGFKASAADLVVQRQNDDEVTEKRKALDFDFQRNVGFLLYGGIYQGCAQEYLYNTFFPSVFGDSQSWVTVLEQVAVDMIVLTPFMCLPVAYMTKALIAADENVVDGLHKYVSHVQNEGLLLRYWSIWAPVQVLTFGFVPTHLRIPFIAFVSFFWLMILSNISSQKTQTTSD
jgi:protein Mpv17